MPPPPPPPGPITITLTNLYPALGAVQVPLDVNTCTSCEPAIGRAVVSVDDCTVTVEVALPSAVLPVLESAVNAPAFGVVPPMAGGEVRPVFVSTVSVTAGNVSV